MTKKDYIKIAQIIKDNRDMVETGHSPEGGVDVIYAHCFLTQLCLILQEDNPNFDATRFLLACK